MWSNRITLERFVFHGAARIKIQEKLDLLGATDEWITELNISAEGGYVSYKVILSDGTSFLIFDDGDEMPLTSKVKNGIDWKPFPTNIPEIEGYYLTTLFYQGRRTVIENLWSVRFKKWSHSHYIVIAYADTPEAYDGEVHSTLQLSEDK